MTTSIATADHYNFENSRNDQTLNKSRSWFFDALFAGGAPQKKNFPPLRFASTALTTCSQMGEDVNLLKTSGTTSPYSCDEFIQFSATRLTTTREQVIGEIRSWSLFEANWDGEGAAAPITRCIKDAVSFVRLLSENIAFPEPMLHASGNTGLFWGDDGIYADIEFLDNNRIAYYIEKNGDKHKGTLNFDSKSLPPVFPALLES